MNQVSHESNQSKRKNRVKYNIKNIIMIVNKIRTNIFHGLKK